MQPSVSRNGLLLTIVCLLSACSSGPLLNHETAGSQQQDFLATTPLPPGAVFVPEKSLIIGGAEHWMGRLTINLPGSVNDAFAYFEAQLPSQGWTLISSVRGDSSILVFTKQDLTATVSFGERSGFTNGQATMTVTPRNSKMVAPPSAPIRR
jgi:hypothetical protein